MARVLRTFPDWLTGNDGARYRARICARRRADERWEAWIEFVMPENGTVIRSRRETVQRNLADAEYWASGLSAVYLDGSLARTLQPRPRPTAPGPLRASFEGPAPEHVEEGEASWQKEGRGGERWPVEPLRATECRAGSAGNGDVPGGSSLMTRLSRMSKSTLRSLLQRCNLLRPGESAETLDRREIALRLLLAARRGDAEAG